MAAAAEDSLTESIKNADQALCFCLCNKFNQAENFLSPLDDSHMYHVVSKATISYLQAILTYEQEYIDQAYEKVKEASHLCDSYRKKQSWGETFSNWLSGPNFDEFTEVELHAELCYAECLLERAMLTFIQDDNLISFIKGGLKIRSAYNIYKHCMQALTQKPKPLENSHNKKEFESGVYMGMGSFNVLLSLLPARVLRLLEWVGFSGNKENGLFWLDKGSHLQGLRSPMCTITLLVYEIVISPLLGIGDTDVPYVQNILNVYLEKFPESSIFLYFSGRLKQTQGLLDEALAEYKESVSVNIDWQQIHHICYWEMMFCYSFQGNWKTAAEYAEILSKESKWSKSSYLYMQGAFLITHQFELRHSGEPDKMKEADDMTETIESILDDVAKYKQRIAGKSIPFEKFAVCRVEKYKATGNLILPGLEIIHIWNGFTMFYKHEDTLSHFLNLADMAMEDYEKIEKDNSKHHQDNLCIILIIKGICLRHLNRTDEAEEVLTTVAQSNPSSHSSKMDSYLPPFASAELGFMYKAMGKEDIALRQLGHTLKRYSKYGLESRLHFRIHSGIESLKEKKTKEANSIDEAEEEFFDVREQPVVNVEASMDTETSVQDHVTANNDTIVVTAPINEHVTHAISTNESIEEDTIANGSVEQDLTVRNSSDVNGNSPVNKKALDINNKRSPRCSPKYWYSKKSPATSRDASPYKSPFETPCTSPNLSEASSEISPAHSSKNNSVGQVRMSKETCL